MPLRIILGALDTFRKLTTYYPIQNTHTHTHMHRPVKWAVESRLRPSELSCSSNHGFLAGNGSYGFYIELTACIRTIGSDARKIK